MTARRPLMPPELREMLGLLGQAAGLPPLPASSSDIGLLGQVAERRSALVRVRLQLLADELDLADKHPSSAAEFLTGFCERTTAALRAELDTPLGYEPRGADQ